MKINEGDKVRCVLDGEDYTVTEIVNSLVFLKSAGGEKQILTGVDSLKIFYKKKEGGAKLWTTLLTVPPQAMKKPQRSSLYTKEESLEMVKVINQEMKKKGGTT